MSLDYSKLSDDELDAIASDDYSRLSDSTLKALAGTEEKKEEPVDLISVPPSPFMTLPGLPTSIPGKEALQTAGQIIKPGIQAAGQLAKTYGGNLGKLTTDVAMGALGLPPPVAGNKALEGIQGMYANVQDYLNKRGAFQPTNLTGGANPEWDAKMNTPHGAPQTPPVGGKPAEQGATFIERMTQKFAPMAAKVAPVLKAAPYVGAGLEGVNALRQAGQNDYTGAGLSTAQAATFLTGAPGAVAGVPLALMQNDYQKWRQLTPEQQKQAAMEALSGTAPGQAW